jgi:hypothetical protein
MHVPTASRPRPAGVRVLITLLVVVAVNVGWLGLKRQVIGPLFGNVGLSDWLTLIFPVVCTAILAPHASYRRIDALHWFVPFIGAGLTIRLAWRVSLLPYRDWPPRKDEIPRMREVHHSGRSDRTLYRLERSRQPSETLG